MWVKVCGNTRLEDCLLAAELGADAVGFVFAPGKRTVTAAQVGAITSHLPPALEKIGVFTTDKPREIADTARAAGLTGVQLHRDYLPAFVAELKGYLARATSVIQVVFRDIGKPEEKQAPDIPYTVMSIYGDELASTPLIDSRMSRGCGGTGKTFDWVTVAGLLQPYRGFPLIVAGGLNPENVATAVTVLQPTGVDVSSGVESSPGVKDAKKIARFIAAARSK